MDNITNILNNLNNVYKRKQNINNFLEEIGKEAIRRQNIERQRLLELEMQRQLDAAARQRQLDEAARQRQLDEAARQRQLDEAARQRQLDEAARQRQLDEAARQNPLNNLVNNARNNYNEYTRSNNNGNTFNKMLEADQKLSNYLEDQYSRTKRDKRLSIEILSGNKLKEKIDSADVNIAAKYASVRYIITKEFGIKKDDGTILHQMVLGKEPNDFQGASKWFILYDNNLIVSVLCYLSNIVPTEQDAGNDNMQSFATRSDNGVKFRNQGYNQILMKYAIQSVSSPTCTFLKLGIEPYNSYLVNVYRKVGFQLIPGIVSPNKYMRYDCPRFDTIKFKLPNENQGTIDIPSFELSRIISWTGTRTGYFYTPEFSDANGHYKLDKDIHKNICNVPDPTDRFQEQEYITAYNRKLTTANNIFKQLSNANKLKYYNEARELAGLSQWNGDPDIEKTVANLSDIGSVDGIYRTVKVFEPGYMNNYYMTEKEYKTNDETIKLRVGERYFITNYLLNNVELNGVKLIDGIQKWRSAFYDLRLIFIQAMRKKIIDYNNNQPINNKLVMHPDFTDIEKTLSYIEMIFWDNLHPYCYFNLSFMENDGKSLVLDYINKNAYPDDDNDYKFVSYMINPHAIHGGDYKALDKNGLTEEQVISGIAAVNLLSWDYDQFLTNMMHEIMHTFRHTESLNHILFQDLYGWIDRLANETGQLNNPIRKLELIADVISFNIMSILLEHSDLSIQEQYNKIKNMPLPICHGQDAEHPPGILRINTLRVIPHIYSVLSQVNLI